MLTLCAAERSDGQVPAEQTNVALNKAAYQSSAINFNDVAHLATDGSPDTFWQSAVEDQPWIYIDLGGARRISGVRLNWGEVAPKGCNIQVCDQAGPPLNWSDVAHLSCTPAQAADAHFTEVEARYVRMIADTGSAPGGCQLKDFEVQGIEPATPAIAAGPLPAADDQGIIPLDGSDWKLQNTLFCHDTAEAISSSSFMPRTWLRAKVPATVLANYIRDGAIPDPDFGAQQRLISESFFQNDFWYRKEFQFAALLPGQHILLNFDGINWKADIYLNGHAVQQIKGAFMRGSADVTTLLLPNQKNVLAVLIHKCANPGPSNTKSFAHYSHNGGILGKDSPTFVASLGWNWMPSVRGRNIGIWDHVSLQQTGSVVLVDPFVQTVVSKDLHHADLKLKVQLKNLENAPVHCVLKAKLGNLEISQPEELAANETKEVTLDKTNFPQLTLENPPLWWPNGYGEQPIQRLQLSVDVNNSISSSKQIAFGIRELAYDISDKTLRISCNGQPIQLNGGNWGMDETMLRYEAKDYDIAVRLHKEMHMTMIRNWVGQVGKEEFFDACDKYGILVWNDFWLANPADGPNPDDDALFMTNVRDRIARIRNHPSLALYCGRNEGNPPKSLNGMADETTTLDGTRYYIPNSASGLVSGHGPYEPKPPSWYFENRGKTLHSELGIVAVPTADTMRQMLPAQDLWPINDLWALHDYYQPRCKVYTKRIDQSYGLSKGLDEFCEKAQLHNLENAKAMLESWRSNSGSGGLIWMSHPAWPSLICQFYDYYLNPTAAYFGARTANEPLHILWNASTNEIKVANNTSQNFTNLHAQAWIYNMDGSQKFHHESDLNSGAGQAAVTCFKLEFPNDLTPVHFIKLKLTSSDKTVSENFYWNGTKEGDYLTLGDLPKTTIAGSWARTDTSGTTILNAHLQNSSAKVAMAICLKVVNDKDPVKRILPVFYDDNYISLLPGESRDVRMEVESTLLQDSAPRIAVDGWNVASFTLPPAK